MNDIDRAVAFPPGDFLLEILEDRGWSQKDFAEIIGRSAKTVNEIIKGKTSITPATAKDIAAATDTNAMFWMNLETAYQLHHDRGEPSPKIARHARLRSLYPVRDMVLRGWITASTDPALLEEQIKGFFGLENIEDEPRLMIAAKKTGLPENINGAQRAWLFRVKQLASAMQVRPYSATTLRAAISKLRQMLVIPDDIRRVPKILDECGIRFVIVEHVPSSKIDGVCFWLDAKSPVIGLSLRLDRIDNFWFVLRHEIEHVLNGDGREVAVVDADTGEVRASDVTAEELRADLAAADFCVPSVDMADFIVRHGRIISESHIENFAARMGVHPGLVAGQVRRRTGDYRRFGRFLVSVRHSIAAGAVTDGYGHAVQL